MSTLRSAEERLRIDRDTRSVRTLELISGLGSFLVLGARAMLKATPDNYDELSQWSLNAAER